MQAGVYLGKENLEVREWPEPRLEAHEILVRVRYAGICGTDMLIFSGKHPRVVPPRVLGHEVFGSVVKAGPSLDATWKEGMRVAVYPLIWCGSCAPCREGNSHVCEKLGLLGIDEDGGFAEYVKATPEQLVPVPDAVSDEQAALVEPLSVAVHVVRTSGFRTGDTALVIGAGPIGNLIAQVLRAAGARAVVVSEVKSFRREFAEHAGFAVMNPAAENLRDALGQTAGEPFVDRVYEATGVPSAYRDAVQACRVRGEIVFVGLPKAPPEIDVLNLVFKEIQTTGARVYARKDYFGALALLERHAVDVTPLITDRLTLKDATLGFQRMHEADTSLKILFAP
jgi:(R,R)-butanediol dehydrogenase/meso-butanediol dehydrogenase/diacetyl reductase